MSGSPAASVDEEIVPPGRRRCRPRPSPSCRATAREGAAAVYLPACINRIFGHARGAERTPACPRRSSRSRAARACRCGSRPTPPGRCCAVPWSSKGLRAGHEQMASATAAAIWRWTGGGELPVVVDASSCTQGIAEEIGEALGEDARERHSRIEVIDSVDLGARAPGAEARGQPQGRERRDPPDLLGSPHRHRHRPRLPGRELAEDVTVPAAAGCCGFAGDRGLPAPRADRRGHAARGGRARGPRLRCLPFRNRTCEVGLERATGQPYRSPILLMEELTR